MVLLQKVSITGEYFKHLIGKDVIFKSDILSIGGQILHHKGEKAFISDVEYTSGYWSRLCPSVYVEPKVSSFKINGIPSVSWRPQAFEPISLNIIK